MPSPDRTIDTAIGFAEIDLQGLYQKHSDMWEMLDKAIRLITTIIALPVIAAGVLVSAEALDLATLQLSELPPVLAYLVLVSGFIGAFMLQIAIHYRLDIIMYARAINSFRDFYLCLLEDNGVRLQTAMPRNRSVPATFEPFRPTGILVMIIAAVNSGYAVLGLTNLGVVPIRQWSAWGLGVLLLAAQYGLYFLATRRQAVLGTGT